MNECVPGKNAYNRLLKSNFPSFTSFPLRLNRIFIQFWCSSFFYSRVWLISYWKEFNLHTPAPNTWWVELPLARLSNNNSVQIVFLLLNGSFYSLVNTWNTFSLLFSSFYARARLWVWRRLMESNFLAWERRREEKTFFIAALMMLFVFRPSKLWTHKDEINTFLPKDATFHLMIRWSGCQNFSHVSWKHSQRLKITQKISFSNSKINTRYTCYFVPLIFGVKIQNEIYWGDF